MAIQRQDITPPDNVLSFHARPLSGERLMDFAGIHISPQPVLDPDWEELAAGRPIWQVLNRETDSREAIREDNIACMVVAAVCAVIVVSMLLWAFGPDVPVIWR